MSRLKEVNFELTLQGRCEDCEYSRREMGYLDEDTRSRIAWLYRSAVGWENKEFCKHWQRVRRAAGRALAERDKWDNRGSR